MALRWGLRRAKQVHLSGDLSRDPARLRSLLSEVESIPPPAATRRVRPEPVPVAARPTPALPPVGEAAGLAMSWGLMLARALPDARFRVTWSGFDQIVEVLTPSGLVRADRRHSSRMRMDAMQQRGEKISRASIELTYPPPEPPSHRQLIAAADALIDRMGRRFEAVTAPDGNATVVLAPGIAGAVVHELVGHALEGDQTGKSSWLRPGDPVGPVGLTVLDDPRRGRAPWRIDDEGQDTIPVLLVQRGVALNRLHDLQSALASGRRPSGHGRRHSFASPVQPRMGCTFIAAGPDDPSEIVSTVGQGIYVRRLESASVDVRIGQATFRVTDADAIESGRIGAPLQPFLLTVDGRHGLSSIDRIGGDLEFDPCIGTCLKDGQPLPTSVGAPTIRIQVAGVHN